MISVKTTIKNSVLLCFTLFLIGCSWFDTPILTETVHYINTPSPLKLEQVEWKVTSQDDIMYYSLDSQNFSNLSLNLQEIQDRLYLQTTLIENQNKSLKK